MRLDPWAAEYTTAYYADTVQEALDSQKIDIRVEQASWQALTPLATNEDAMPWQRLLFSDGSRRIEARVLLEDDDNIHLAFGAMGSYAIGLVHCCPKQPSSFAAHFVDTASVVGIPNVHRLCALSHGREREDIALPADLQRSFGSLRYTISPCEHTEADAVIQQVQNEMLKAERRLISAVMHHYDDALIICDGQNPLLESPQAHNVVGYVKTIHQLRVAREQLEVVCALKEGQRSPLYLVMPENSKKSPYFECFLRLRDPSPWLYSLAGMVRLQFFAGKDPERMLEPAQKRADWLSLNLPRFASRQYQDPRAPQQLLPVRALEAELRRRMGNAQLIRQRIMAYLRDSNR